MTSSTGFDIEIFSKMLPFVKNCYQLHHSDALGNPIKESNFFVYPGNLTSWGRLEIVFDNSAYIVMRVFYKNTVGDLFCQKVKFKFYSVENNNNFILISADQRFRDFYELVAQSRNLKNGGLIKYLHISILAGPPYTEGSLFSKFPNDLILK